MFYFILIFLPPSVKSWPLWNSKMPMWIKKKSKKNPIPLNANAKWSLIYLNLVSSLYVLAWDLSHLPTLLEVVQEFVPTSAHNPLTLVDEVWSIKLRQQRALLHLLLTGWDYKTSECLNTLQAEPCKDRYFVNESSHLPFYQQHRAHARRCQLWNLTRVVLLHNRDISSQNLWVLSERLSAVMYFQIRKGLGFQRTRTLP